MFSKTMTFALSVLVFLPSCGKSKDTSHRQPQSNQRAAGSVSLKEDFLSLCKKRENLAKETKTTVSALLHAAGTETCETAWEVLSNKKELSLFGTDTFQLSDLTPLAFFPQLEFLILGDNPISDIKLLSTLSNLKHLDLFHTNVVDFAPLSALSNLKSLVFTPRAFAQPSYVPANIEVIGTLPHLVRLQLSGANIASASFLTGLKELTALELGQNRLDDISFLSSLPNLKQLDLRGNSIHDFSPLKSLSADVVVSIERNPVKPELCPVDTANFSVTKECSQERLRFECMKSGKLLDLMSKQCADPNQGELAFKDIFYSPGSALLSSYYMDFDEPAGGDRNYYDIDTFWLFDSDQREERASWSVDFLSLPCESAGALEEELLQKHLKAGHDTQKKDAGEGKLKWRRIDLRYQYGHERISIFEKNPATNRCAVISVGAFGGNQTQGFLEETTFEKNLLASIHY